MTKKQKRLGLTAAVFIAAAAAVGLTLKALSGSITYFYTPSDLAGLVAPPDRSIRLGGLVETGSLIYADGAAKKGAVKVAFVVTDGEAQLPVSYAGILPDLFREGQGVIVEGRLEGGVLVADSVLAKHDENYMPKEVADALKAKGRWKEGETGY